MTIRSWLKEPLVHFLLAGGVIFLALSAFDHGPDTGRTITVSQDDLLVFMQGRAQVYDEETFAAMLAEMPPEERERLVTETATQEALYREAEALGLAQSDPLIRQRLVQQMRLLLMEEAAADIDVSDAEVRAYFDANGERYAADPRVTFTHVFLPPATGTAQVEQVLTRLQTDDVAPGEAGQYGARFLYQANYADANPALVESHFGSEFAQALFDLEPGTWQGPLRSEHGWHLVLPLSVEGASEADFAAIEERVRADALADKRSAAGQAALDRLLDRFTVETEGGIGS